MIRDQIRISIRFKLRLILNLIGNLTFINAVHQLSVIKKLTGILKASFLSTIQMTNFN